MNALTKAEARHLAQGVRALPEPRRSTVRARFETALLTLKDAGLLQRLQQWHTWTEAEYRAQVTAYFAAAVPCPGPPGASGAAPSSLRPRCLSSQVAACTAGWQ